MFEYFWLAELETFAPKHPATFTTSIMSTLPSWFRSARGSQFEEVGLVPKCANTKFRSSSPTTPSPLISHTAHGLGALTDTKVVVEWEMFPFTPVIVTLYVPGRVEEKVNTVSMAETLPLRGTWTVIVLKVPVIEVDNTMMESVTGPLNPLMLDRVIVEFAEEPAVIVRLFAVIPKSGGGGCSTVTSIATEWTSDPLVPITITVKLPGVAELRKRIAVPGPVTV